MLCALLRRKAAVAKAEFWRGGCWDGLRRRAAAGGCEVAGKKWTEDMVAEEEEKVVARASPASASADVGLLGRRDEDKPSVDSTVDDYGAWSLW